MVVSATYIPARINHTANIANPINGMLAYQSLISNKVINGSDKSEQAADVLQEVPYDAYDRQQCHKQAD